MTDTLELEIAMKRARLTQEKVAKLMGLSKYGFYKKLHKLAEFKASEVAKLYDILKLKSLEEQQQIFSNKQ